MVTDFDIRSIRNNVGERIRALRKEHGLTQSRLGMMVDLDRTYIVGIEKGRRNVSLDNLIKISLGLNTPLSELFDSVDAEVVAQLENLELKPENPPPEPKSRAPVIGASPKDWESSGDGVPREGGISLERGI